ncbi:MAG: nuclear transport factor 2 family protein [Pseudomonadota bacterium]
MNDAGLERIASFFESFTRRDLERLGEFYADDAAFKDPFNEVRGLEAIRRIYDHMFETLNEPRFVIKSRMTQGDECWLAWEFTFRFRAWRPQEAQLVRGASHLTLDAQGRIRAHRDYWDAAEEVYEKLPLVGALMRWLKRRAAA